MTGQLNHLVAAEQIADRHRAAARAHLVAETREPRTREPGDRSTRTTRTWFSLRRNPKLA